MDISKMVEAYVKIRDRRDHIKKEYEAQDRDLQNQLDVIEAAVLESCKANGVESFRTEFGTATRVVRERFMPADRDGFRNFILASPEERVDLLELRIHQGNYKEWAAANPDVAAPINADRRYAISVRRK